MAADVISAAAFRACSSLNLTISVVLPTESARAFGRSPQQPQRPLRHWQDKHEARQFVVMPDSRMEARSCRNNVVSKWVFRQHPTLRSWRVITRISVNVVCVFGPQPEQPSRHSYELKTRSPLITPKVFSKWPVGCLVSGAALQQRMINENSFSHRTLLSLHLKLFVAGLKWEWFGNSRLFLKKKKSESNRSWFLLMMLSRKPSNETR